MFNLLSGEFYKLRKSKSLLLCCAAIVFFIIFMYGMLTIVDRVQKGEIKNGPGGVYVSVNGIDGNAESVFDEFTVMEVLGQMFCSFGSFATAIFAAIFVIGEYTNGAVKNIIGKGYARWQVFLAKYIAAMAATVLQLLIMSVVTLICGSIIEGTKQYDTIFWKNLLHYIGIQFLLGIAFVGLVAAICEISRNLAAGIAIGIGLLCFSTLLTTGLDLLTNLLLPQAEWKPSNYWIIDLISRCPIEDMSKEFAGFASMVAVLWIVFAAAVGIWHIQKADIK